LIHVISEAVLHVNMTPLTAEDRSTANKDFVN